VHQYQAHHKQAIANSITSCIWLWYFVCIPCSTTQRDESE